LTVPADLLQQMDKCVDCNGFVVRHTASDTG
jgi:hypothetical protein